MVLDTPTSDNMEFEFQTVTPLLKTVTIRVDELKPGMGFNTKTIFSDIRISIIKLGLMSQCSES